jgi:hypothetical protein
VALSVNPQRRQIIEKPSNISSSNGTTASEEKSNAGLIIEALSGPLCYNDGGSVALPADLNDLRPSLPHTHLLRPAYSATACTYETWVIKSAAFAWCNCNPCISIYSNSLQAKCEGIYDFCIALVDSDNPNVRGFYTQSSPNAFWTLYNSNVGDDPGDLPPNYESC